MDILDHDQRIARLPMMDSPIPTFLIGLVYLMFVKVLGPAWMKNRKPYDLRGLLIAHNFILVIVNAWLFHKFGNHGWYWKYRWTCANVDYLETEDSLAMVKVAWLFYLSKFLDMGDSVFFVLRKKESQITFLHVVHHAFVPLTSWYTISLGASGYNTVFGFLNTFVHTWMYLYYGLSALGPSIQKYLWWKKYLTSLQILQFCIVVLATISVMITPGCKVSARIIEINLGQALFFLILFVHFYRKSYKTQKKTKSSGNDAGSKVFTQQKELNGDGVNKKPLRND